MKKLLVSLTALFLLLQTKPVQAQLIEIKDAGNFAIKKIEGNKAYVSFTVKVVNSSNKNFGIKVKKGKFYKNNEQIGSFKLSEKLRVSKGENEQIPIQVTVQFNENINLLMDGISLMMGNPVEVSVNGVFKATWLIFWKKYPFELSDKVSLKKFMGN